LPGCGKTSTVIAAATYLQKDIYYLNLNGVKTNEDLGMLFDYVVKETTTSGIIVMEDIDAMTQVVHKREEDGNKNQRASTAAELIENNESALTLEYFLNILQGTLTRDNSVFIATTNHLEVLDPAFYRAGRFDIKIEMKPADYYQIEQIYQTFFDRAINQENLRRIPEYKYTPAQFIFKFAEYIMNPTASDEEILGEFYN
jgi:ATP-dependent 26S proteasome regulatory subunit